MKQTLPNFRYWMQETITDSTVASFTPWMITSTHIPQKKPSCSTHFRVLQLQNGWKNPSNFHQKSDENVGCWCFLSPISRHKNDISVTPHIKPYQSWMPRPIKLLSRPEHSAGCEKVPNGWCFCKECYTKIVGPPLLGFKRDSKLALGTECFIHV